MRPSRPRTGGGRRPLVGSSWIAVRGREGWFGHMPSIWPPAFHSQTRGETPHNPVELTLRVGSIPTSGTNHTVVDNVRGLSPDARRGCRARWAAWFHGIGGDHAALPSGYRAHVA